MPTVSRIFWNRWTLGHPAGPRGFLGLPGPRGFRGCWMPNSWPTLWVSVLPWVRAKAPAGSRPWLAIAEGKAFPWVFHEQVLVNPSFTKRKLGGYPPFKLEAVGFHVGTLDQIFFWGHILTWLQMPRCQSIVPYPKANCSPTFTAATRPSVPLRRHPFGCKPCASLVPYQKSPCSQMWWTITPASAAAMARVSGSMPWVCWEGWSTWKFKRVSWALVLPWCLGLKAGHGKLDAGFRSFMTFVWHVCMTCLYDMFVWHVCFPTATHATIWTRETQMANMFQHFQPTDLLVSFPTLAAFCNSIPCSQEVTFSILESMPWHFVLPNAFSFSTAISCQGFSSRDWQRPLALLSEMPTRQLEPNLVCFNVPKRARIRCPVTFNRRASLKGRFRVSHHPTSWKH